MARPWAGTSLFMWSTNCGGSGQKGKGLMGPSIGILIVFGIVLVIIVFVTLEFGLLCRVMPAT